MKDKKETQAFLIIAAVSKALQQAAEEQLKKLKPEEFHVWIQNAGELILEQHGSDVKAIIVTEVNKGEIMKLIQKLSESLSETSSQLEQPDASS